MTRSTDLRSTLLRQAAEVIARDGTDDLSLRAVAREAGVSHAAHRHHFSGRAGLLTALATEGFRELAGRLRAARRDGDLVEVGVAYVQFAQDRPAHFAVMFSPAVLEPDDPELVLAQDDAFEVLRAGVDTKVVDGAVQDAAAAVLAGWSLVHGLATLAASGALDGAGLRAMLGDQDLAAVTRRAAGLLYGSPTGRS